jgi:AcrR family transcriptional regulator
VILRSAAQVFGRRGYAAASMDDIAAAAGVTKLILYRHFVSKAALYRTVLQQVADQISERFLVRRAVDSFGVGARSVLQLAREDSAGFHLFWRHAGREPEFSRYAGTLRAEAVSAVRSSLADRVPAELLEWAAHAVVGYLVEAVLNWLEFGDPARDDQFVRATNKAMRAGVRAWTEFSDSR